jgi:hypothetical protein
MINRYCTPNDIVLTEKGYSLSWHLREGDFLPGSPSGQGLLDMDMQPVTDNIEGPAVVQVDFDKSKKVDERGACIIIRHTKHECECEVCEAEIVRHGRMLTLPERRLFEQMATNLLMMRSKHPGDNLSGTSDIDEVVAFQFSACIAADLLPWASHSMPEDRPPSLDVFKERYTIQHLAKAGEDGEVIMLPISELEDEIASLKELIDLSLAGVVSTKETMRGDLLTQITQKVCANGSAEGMTEEEFRDFCDKNKPTK